jgi:hypothetical protein
VSLFNPPINKSCSFRNTKKFNVSFWIFSSIVLRQVYRLYMEFHQLYARAYVGRKLLNRDKTEY